MGSENQSSPSPSSTPHPTSLVHGATVGLLRGVALCAGLHADNAQRDAIATLAGLMRLVVKAGCSKPDSSE